jgi:vacuolar-type H+-ATPase subunit C/Vma6
MDVIMDREMFGHLTTVLERYQIPFLSGWVEREIDLANIRAFFRLLWAQEAPDLLRESLIGGGSLAPEFYRKIQDEPQEALAQRFAPTRYGRCVEEGSSSFRAKGSFARLEGLSDSLLITYLRTSAYTAFGVEPLMAYGLLVEFEIKALRTAAVGVANAVPQEFIQERLPDVYL